MKNLSSTIKTVKALVTANSPILLVGTAIAGVVSTGVLAAKGGYKARGIIDEAAVVKGESLTVQEQSKLTWKCYTVPVLTGVSTIASIVGVHTIHTKRHAALAGLYAMTTAKLDEHIDKAEELLGPKKTQALTNTLSQEALDVNPLGDKEILMTGENAELCNDRFSGRYFMSSLQSIEQAFNEANRQIIDTGDCSLNDLYNYMGLSDVPMGEAFGWSGDEKILPKIGSAVAADGRASIVVDFRRTPTPRGAVCP